MKLSVLLVEDEPIEREALHIMIQNHCEEVGQIYLAQNGFEAIALCKQHCIDFVFVDINMPGINGLETIKQIKALQSRTMFLIVSSYNRFEYAQEALKLGVEDFIVKPITLEQIKRSIALLAQKIQHTQQTNIMHSGLLERIEAIKPVLESDLIYCIISNGSAAEMEKLFAFYDSPFCSGFCIAVDLQMKQQHFFNTIKQYIQTAGFSCMGGMFNEIFVYCIYSQRLIDKKQSAQMKDFIMMLFKKEGWTQSSLGVGQITHSVMGLYESYRQAMLALRSLELRADGVSIAPSLQTVKKEVDTEACATQCANAMLSGEYSDFMQAAQEVMIDVILLVEDFEQSKGVAGKILILTEKRALDALPSSALLGMDALKTVNACADSKQLQSNFMSLMEQMWQQAAYIRHNRQSMIVRNALGYIKENYSNQLPLEELAQTLDVSTYYLSKLLKKHTKSSFTDLVSTMRIEKAKQLLQSNKSVKEVTFAVGFNSQNYFSKVFRKYVGITPSEYKEQTAVNPRLE